MNFPGAAYIRKVTKHTRIRIQDEQAGPQGKQGQSTGCGNKRPAGPDKQHRSSSASAKSWNAPSQVVNPTDIIDAEQEEAQTSGQTEPRQYEQHQVRWA
jgi:hypothetical protein